MFPEIELYTRYVKVKIISSAGTLFVISVHE
jgi:hypothetical protein